MEHAAKETALSKGERRRGGDEHEGCQHVVLIYSKANSHRACRHDARGISSSDRDVSSHGRRQKAKRFFSHPVKNQKRRRNTVRWKYAIVILVHDASAPSMAQLRAFTVLAGHSRRDAPRTYGKFETSRVLSFSGDRDNSIIPRKEKQI